MKIIDIELDIEVQAEITKATKKDIKMISKAKTFVFDWRIYERSDEYEIFKLCIEETKEILGLMCLKDWPERGHKYVEVVTLELRSDQIGRRKKYTRMAGCLFAFAARVSFQKGHDGWLMLIAKTKTAPVFEKEYGFFHLGTINSLAPKMASGSDNSEWLISEYLDH